ncbi:MAG TPA: hypothetical protein VHD33_06745, partial [Legionellaceae bacterium]|nr:hypothetical protein [Legionellaceae bacterium]
SYINEPQQQAVLQILDHLDIFKMTDDAACFLRLTIVIMLQWTSEYNHRSSKDAAKWIKTILGIPYQSEMAQILNLMADYFHLGECVLEGASRNMDCLELFFLLQNLTLDTDLILVNESNKEILTHIQATMLIVMIYKHSPHAFYDVMALPEQHQRPAVLNILKTYQNHIPQLRDFFQIHTGFTPYYNQQELSTHLNEDIFLKALIQHIHTIVSSPLQKNPDIQKMWDFIMICQKQLRHLDQHAFTHWLKMYTITHPFESLMETLLLKPICDLALNHKSCNSGRIRSSALQLVTLGFSHRSASALATGRFQPLVNTEIAAIDVKNMRAFALYFQQQSPLIKHLLTQEILILCAMHVINTHQYQVDIDVNMNPKSQNLTQFYTPKVDTVPQKTRINPVQRHYLFTSKFAILNELGDRKIILKQ